VTDRIVQTTWTDGGPHQPLPPPDDPQGDEIERLTARIAELEAKLERCVRLAARVIEYHREDVPRVLRWTQSTDWGQPWWREYIEAIRAALETPKPLA
jgi:hypothetical protein